MIGIKTKIRAFIADRSGTTMVEFAICIAMFLLILFAVLDFGRLGYNWVMTEKAMQRAVRIAAVRPPVCANVPFYHRRNVADTSDLDPGARCSANGGALCENFQTQCLLSEAIAATPAENTANEIWDSIQVLLPSDATEDNILVEYRYDGNLGFLGGPFTPVITVSLVGGVNQGDPLDFYFEFITPLSALAGSAGAANAASMFPETVAACANPCIPFPAIAVSLPAEDMNVGNDG